MPEFKRLKHNIEKLIVGKTIASVYMFGSTAILFTDGTYVVGSSVNSDAGDGEPGNMNWDEHAVDPFLLRGIGVITEEEMRSRERAALEARVVEAEHHAKYLADKLAKL